MKKQTGKCKIATIPISIYSKKVIVAVGEFDVEAIAEHISTEKEKNNFRQEIQQNDISSYDGLVFNLGTGNEILWLKFPPKSEEDISTLAHEAFHAAYDILKRVGIPLSSSSEEAYAYLIGYITEQVLKLTQPKEAKKSR